MPLAYTRSVLRGILNGSLSKSQFNEDKNFGFSVPLSIPFVDSKLLNPRNTWKDPGLYDKQAAKLVAMFSANFDKYKSSVDKSVRLVAL